ncbi:hypothetical protein EW145_g1768 [Phellinidium pouzarii]|uniref:Endoribonuclease YSH1 n=1 Tax=Phellinidium pouzarii TaxID=167371 RepID=A0A4S4LIV3_9AGAM|nr:hypothetical protein EW145_g1768 [Phellinidium pouzarii]
MSDYPTLSVTLLGAGQEVGRSCCVLQYRGKTVVCDAGVHLAYNGMASLPFVDELDWSTVDALLVTHFHLDHAASLTYIMEKTNFKDGKGKVSTSADALFSSEDLTNSLSSIIAVSAHQLITVSPGLSFTPYHAGHVLGACDYSREEDRHLVKAEVPPVRPDVLIVESTYGVQGHEGREEKELRFTSLVHTIIRRGGHVLMPTFALGRAQELLLILEEYWKKHPDLHNVPIYYASNLARKCMAIYQTYIHTMNSNIRSRFAKRDNPFVFKHISNLPQARGWEKKISEGPPCVVLASPGMLQVGPSRELLELWAPDARNGLIITGYSVEGTMARDIINEPEEIVGVKGGTIPRRISVDYISFSAHVDYPQNSEFIDLVKAQHVVLVHGEQMAMGRLRGALQQRYKDREEEIKIHTPRNLETLNLTFRGERVAKAIGTLAANPPKSNSILSGLLVSKDYSYTLLDPRDLRDFAGLSTCIVTQRQKIALGVGWELVRWHLEGMYGTIEEGLDGNNVPTMRVMSAVDVKHTKEHELTLEWETSASNDMIADSCLALILGIDKSPASVKLTTHSHSHNHEHPHADVEENSLIVRIQRLAMFLEAHFGDVELHMPEQPAADDEDNATVDATGLLIQLDDSEAFIDLATMAVESSNEVLRKRVEAVLDMALTTVSSLSESYTSGVPLVMPVEEKKEKCIVEDVHAHPFKPEESEEEEKPVNANGVDVEGGAEQEDAPPDADESDESEDDGVLETIPTMAATLFSVTLAFVSILHVHAESHSIMFKNKYLQTGECGLNGENCLTVEMNMNNPACAGCGSSVDLSLIPPHAFVVETAFQFYGGDGNTCDGLGADCADGNCDTAFFQSNDNQVQRACQIDNVNLLITFCGAGTTQFTKAVAGSLSGISDSNGGSVSIAPASSTSPSVPSSSPAASSLAASSLSSAVHSTPAASSPAAASPSPGTSSPSPAAPYSSPSVSSSAASSPVVSSPTATSGNSDVGSPSTLALDASAPASSSTSTTKTCKRRSSLPAKRVTSLKNHSRSQRRARDFSVVHGSF